LGACDRTDGGIAGGRRRPGDDAGQPRGTRGSDIEAVPFATDPPRAKLACAVSISAIHVQQMLHDRDGTAACPMEDVCASEDIPRIEAIGRTLEGKTVEQKNPHPPGTLARAAWICARLGGWTGYYGKPGPVVLVRGYAKLEAMLDGIDRCGDV